MMYWILALTSTGSIVLTSMGFRKDSVEVCNKRREILSDGRNHYK